ncbi:MAG TPA: hypothetical protein PLN07_09875 [Myxococcota bacterium]|nr:hypothetical protein [Myxococcota bacterium]
MYSNTKTAKRRKYAFVAHWVETWNIWLRISNDLQLHPEHAWRWAILWPVAFVISVILMAGRKACDVVDRFFVNDNLAGEIVVVRFYGYQFMFRQLKLHNRIRRMILQTVIDTQDSGVEVIGLGALCKDEGLTKGGEWIVNQLGDQLRVPLVHGDTLTAAAVIQRGRQLIEHYGLEGKPVMLTGSTSKIGRAIALEFARRGIKVFMYTASPERFRSIQTEAGDNGHLLVHVDRLELGVEAGLWITGKANKGTGELLLKVLPRDAVVLNFAVPDPLSPKLLRTRPDVHHFDGGLIGFDPKKSTLQFNMRLKPGITYACHAGTMVHAAEAWTHNEVGPVQVDQLEPVWNAALKNGLDLPILTSFLKPVEFKESFKAQVTCEDDWSLKASGW